MAKLLKYISSIVLAMGLLWVSGITIWMLTDKFTVFTSEAWRRKSIEKSAKQIPEISLEDERGRTHQVSDYCGKVMVVDFIYTSCPTVCKSQGAISSQLARAFEKNGLDVSVISVSIDPKKDTPDRMFQFKRSMESLRSKWKIVRILNPDEHADIIRLFGVVAIPDKFGGFEHNSALHIVDKSCRLVKILNEDDIDGAERIVNRLVRNEM